MKFIVPEYKPSNSTADFDKDALIADASHWISGISANQFIKEFRTDNIVNETKYREYREKAVEHECEDVFLDIVKRHEEENNCKFWALPKPLEKKAFNNPFPLDMLPNALKKYLKSVSQYGQVPIEMCALPMLSALAACAQGKARIEAPQNGYPSELTLFTLTVAPSSAGKSSSNCFFKPIYDYVKRWNDIHELEITQNQSERDFLKQQQSHEKKKSSGSLQRIKEIDKELKQLPDLSPMKLVISDATPEALIYTMNNNGGKIAVLDSEGGILSTISRSYNGNSTDISFFCTAYDGAYYSSGRVTTGMKDIPRPLLTLGLLTQPKKFFEFMNNEEFIEKGFVYRFMFSFVEYQPGYKKFSNFRIPQDEIDSYNSIIKKLLSMPDSDIVLTHDNESYRIFEGLYNHIQVNERTGGTFESIANYTEKQYTTALKIAALLHLCEHELTEPISGQNAQRAISIVTWSINEAIRAFSGDNNEDPVISLANKVCEKMNDKQWHTLTELRHVLHIGRKSDKDTTFQNALEILIDCNWIQDNGKHFDERGCMVLLNPILIQKKK